MNIKTLDEFMYKVPGYGRIRYFFEKRIKGFTNYEIGDLDVLTSQFLVPRLKAFKKETYAYPTDLTMEQWQEILDDMIFSILNLLLATILSQANQICVTKLAKKLSLNTIMLFGGKEKYYPDLQF